MQTDPLTPRDLYDNVDFYRIQSNMVAQKYRNGTAVGPQFRLSGTKLDIARRLDCELAVLNLED